MQVQEPPKGLNLVLQHFAFALPVLCAGVAVPLKLPQL